MAYDKIITVRSRLDHCVDYVLNHEKTDMAAVLDYIGRTDKNALPDGRSVLETAINCDLESAYQPRLFRTSGIPGITPRRNVKPHSPAATLTVLA